MRGHTGTLVAVVLLLAAVGIGLARMSGSQQVRASQRGTVSQMVGTTEITVVYNRPVARDRELFGELVPFGEIWNPGANEATTIEVSHDVLVQGQPLPAGRYSIWAIPDSSEWTLVFSQAADVWHAPYPEGDDALRVSSEPVNGSHMETLAFYFPVVGPNRATLHLHWGTTIVPLEIEISRQQT